MKATLRGVSQVTFISNWKTGIFWVVGLTLAFELAPVVTSVVTDDPIRPWWSNAYTAQWHEIAEFSILYFGVI